MLRSNVLAETAEAIVIDVRSKPEGTPPTFQDLEDHGFGLRIADDIRELPNYATMPDGRRWNGLPVIVYGFSISEGRPRKVADPSGSRGIELYTGGFDDLFDTVSELVADYRRALLDEFSNLGYLVVEDRGRFRVGPALTARDEREGRLYSASSDGRAAQRYFTVDRNLIGIQYELDVFESLITRDDVRERELHNFFIAHPHFLTQNLSEAISQPSFPRVDRGPLIPDFLLRPIVAQQRDSRWEVLDLKLPQVRLLSGPQGRPQLSYKVHQALAQLRDYRDYFRQDANTDAVEAVLGRPLRRPRLAVLIGRMPPGAAINALEQAQAEEAVRIVTYDEILEGQREHYRWR